MMTNASMTENERRKVFWLLKKYSSYTAWEALAQAYYRFADAFMEAIRLVDHTKADALDEESFADEARVILDGRIGFEIGLPLLKSGDRSVWRRSRNHSFAAWGALARGVYEVSFIRRILDPQEYELGWIKNLQEVIARKDALLFWTARVGVVTERVEVTHPAPMSAYDALETVHPRYRYLMNDPAYLNFPNVLPSVPEPTEVAFQTGDVVCADGIYEPEWGDVEAQGLHHVLDRLNGPRGSRPSLVDVDANATQIARHRANIGCMNYFLGSTVAPPYQHVEIDKPLLVKWRLLWKDDRYRDGGIPPEEAEYLAPLSAPVTAGAQLRCESGHSCPREGWWFTPAKPESRRHFAQGEVLPAFGADYGAVIWQWDERQGP